MTTPLHSRFAALAFGPGDLLTTEQVASAIGLSHRTLAAWRSSRRGGPGWIKCGNRVRYRRQDVIDWLESCTQSTEAAGRRP